MIIRFVINFYRRFFLGLTIRRLISRIARINDSTSTKLWIKLPVLGLLLLGSEAVADTVYLTSLSWPPYAGKQLEQQGAGVLVARSAFKAMGHELIVDFYPWSRAVKLAKDKNSKYSGYFPEYLHKSGLFEFSEVMGQGPLGLLENKAEPLTWSSIADLKNYQLGVVQDYVNTEEIDKLIINGSLKVQVVMSDELNIKKVNGGRINGAIIDVNVFNYLLNNDEKIKLLKNNLQINRKLLAIETFHIAFNKSENSGRWLSIFNQGIKLIDAELIMENYFHSKGNISGANR